MAYWSDERRDDPRADHPEAPDDGRLVAARGGAARVRAGLLRRHERKASLAAAPAGCGTSFTGTISDSSCAGSDPARHRGPDDLDSRPGACALP